MVVDLGVWTSFDVEKDALLKSLQLPIPNIPPFLALNAELRASSHNSYHATTSTLLSHLQRIDMLIEELQAARRHLTKHLNCVKISLAPIAVLTPSLLAEIFCLSALRCHRTSTREVRRLSLVCSAWQDIVHGMPELFTIWNLHGSNARHLAKMAGLWRQRSNGKYLGVTIHESVMTQLFTHSPQVSSPDVASEWSILKGELERSSPKIARLELSLPTKNLCHVFNKWLTKQDFGHLAKLIISDDGPRRFDSPTTLHLPSLPHLRTVLVRTAVVAGNLSNVRSLTCLSDSISVILRRWTRWSAMIASCTGLGYLKLAIPESAMTNDWVLELPNLLELEIGCSGKPPSNSTQPEGAALVWQALAEAMPLIVSLSVVENRGTPFPPLDALSTPSGSSSTLLFPHLVQLRIFSTTLPSSQMGQESLEKLLETRLEANLLRIFTTSIEINAWLRKNRATFLNQIRSVYPKFKIYQVASVDFPRLWS